MLKLAELLLINFYAENDTQHDADVETDAITLQMTYELNENVTTYIGGYRDVTEDHYDYDGSAAPFITLERWNVYDQTSHEFQLNGSFANVELTAGLYMFEKEHTQDWATGGTYGGSFGAALSAPGQWELCRTAQNYLFRCMDLQTCIPTIFIPNSLFYSKSRSKAAYAQMDWSVTAVGHLQVVLDILKRKGFLRWSSLSCWSPV